MGADKALLVVDGQPLYLRVASRLATIASPVLVASGTRGRLGPTGFDEVDDARPGSGPLGGIVAGLRATQVAFLAVAAVDMPDISPGVFAVLRARMSEDIDVAVPMGDGLPQPLHAVYARRALPRLEAALDAGRLTMRHALAGLRVETVTEAECRAADPSGAFARNVNTREDLDARISTRGTETA
jgi:molybdopterin-guanine dinucleotide biosynthesis protein A